MQNNWQISKNKSPDIIEQLLLNRGVNLKDREKFFNPSFDKDLYDPMTLPHIRKALSLIKKIKKENIPAAIWGDYDTDGVTSAALLYETFIHLKIKPKVYIPTRQEGYGLNIGGIDKLAKYGIEAIFVVDAGIANIEEIDYANNLGIKIVVLDHHLPEKELPKAYAVIDTKISESKYPFENLSACGVVYKFVQALHQKYPKDITESFIKWSLDLVGISTAADLVELRDENRTLMKYAFRVLPRIRRVGLKALFEVARIDPSTITMYTLWYLIAPRLNAPGRINDANIAFKLLVEKDEKKAVEYAKSLDKQNRQRQEMLEKAILEAENKVTKKEAKKDKIIVIGSKTWPSGIVGLIAGKMVEKYNVPALVYFRGKNVSKGSARSIEKFDVTEALRRSRKYLIGCGGHKMAAGFSFKNKDLKQFKRKMIAIARSEIKDEDLVKTIKIDAEIQLYNINLDFFEKLKKFEPTGFGNPRIIFVARNVEIKQIRGVGKSSKHLKMSLAIDPVKSRRHRGAHNGEQFDRVDHKKINAETVADDKRTDIAQMPFEPSHSAIGFDQGHWCKHLKQNDRIDIAFTVDEDSWGGEKRIDLKIIDIHRLK